MPKATHIKVSGTWRTVINIWRKTSGVWTEKAISWIRVSGTWKDCMAYVPAVPTGLSLSQPTPNDYIRAQWNSVSGATSYTLQRKPYWNGSSWTNSYFTVYVGGNTTYNDSIQNEHQPDEMQTFTYHVLASNDAGSSAYSSEATIDWTTGM